MVIDAHEDLCTGTALARDLVLTAAHCVAAGRAYQVKTFRTGQAIAVRAARAASAFRPRELRGGSRATADLALPQACQRRSPSWWIPAKLAKPRRVAVGEEAHHRRFRRHRSRHRTRPRHPAHGYA